MWTSGRFCDIRIRAALEFPASGSLRFFSQCRRHLCTVLMLICVAAAAWKPSSAQTSASDHGVVPVELILPTDNAALLQGDGPAFYMYTDRQIKPGFEAPWNGGRYGFVRNGVQTRWGILYQRFHEGIDIRPVARTASGEPLDEVRSIADGVVVHANTVSRHSNYGLYVVVEHWWHGSPYYALYAHLKAIHVRIDQPVVQGEVLGLLGYTGRGINQRRAHLHFEINLLINQYFQGCYEDYFPDNENHHGPFNGLNLSGVDVAALYTTMAADPLFSVRKQVQNTPGFFRVTIPAGGMLDILWRYPWLSPQLNGWLPEFGAPADLASSWAITFSRSGLPVQIDALDQAVEEPVLEILESTDIPYRYLTNNLVTGSGDKPVLTRSGRRVVDFVACPAPELLDFRW